MAPAVRLMHCLSYPYKFALIGAVALLVCALQFYPLAVKLQESIAVAEQELVGLAVDKPLLTFIQVLQQHRGLSAAVLGGVTQLQAQRQAKEAEVDVAVKAVDLAVAQHGLRLNILEHWQVTHQHWQQLRSQGPQMTVDLNRAAHTALIKELLALLDVIGDNSFLILDSELDSYYLVYGLTKDLPRTLEMLGQLRAHGAGVLATKTIDEAGRFDFADEVAVLRAKQEELHITLKKIETTSPVLAGKIQEFDAQFRLATTAILHIVSEDIVAARFNTAAEHYVAQTTAAINLGFEQAHALLLPLLERSLKARIAKDRQNYMVAVALALGFILSFSYLAMAVYLAVMASIGALQRGADRMAEGDLSTPIVLESRDELSLVADSFNHMGAQLALRTDQLHEAGSTLNQVQAEFEKEHPLAQLAAVVPAIAHDLNTPISNINLAANSLQQMIREFQAELAEERLRRSSLQRFSTSMAEGVDIIARAGLRAINLVASLKQFSIDQASQRRRSFELHQLLEDVLATLAPSLRGAVWKIQSEVPEGLLLDSYPGPFGQVLLNLVQNVALHAFEGRNEGNLLISAQIEDDDYLCMQVRDNGCGMRPETLAQIFHPFFTTKPHAGGSGIGLTYAMRLSRDMLGGSLTVASEFGVGTCFTLRVPRVAPVLERAAGPHSGDNGETE
jgi:signal transduction histidine kinase